MKLLIVDDSKAARMLIKSIISEYNSTVTVIEAENGETAVEIYKKERPDLVFLDLTMPVMSGFDALKLIMEFDSDASVIVLTADIQEKSVEKCIALGAEGVMKKLPQKDVIFKTLDKFADGRDE